MSKDKFITFHDDPVIFKDLDTGEEVKLPKYGVWSTSGRKPHVIDTGEDLEVLMKKHDVPKDHVFNEKDMYSKD